MRTDTLSPEFAAALRGALVERVARAARPRRRRLLAGAGIGLVAVLVGGGAAVATGALVLPGGNEVTELAGPAAGAFEGSGELVLGAPPAGANAVEVEFTCLSAGHYSFPSESPDPSRPADPEVLTGIECTVPDEAPVTGLVPLAAIEGQSLTVETDPGARWTAEARYVRMETTDWGVNGSGVTFGLHNERGDPELVAALATNGRPGYVYAEDVQGETPASPEEAAELTGKGLEDRVIPVYEADGITVIGEFVIHGASSVTIIEGEDRGFSRRIAVGED
ncbi:hypothetical protein MUN77_16180 [Leucobacter allii]|uniref:hypothetical protein n=1 Tax=Leucobacter allii TaxID=2932247 RepID=UPI001FD1F757|nr:hypothetical protein [Leucobacter allii]UOR01631.1 hypothetical protein MUN77_16180 [Leucobacter allii]